VIRGAPKESDTSPKNKEIPGCTSQPDDAKILIVIDLKERSRKRRETIETHRTRSIADAEAWDLEYWQRQTPEERLSALVAIHRDVALVEAAKSETSGPGR
jgi:hypothetical protein